MAFVPMVLVLPFPPSIRSISTTCAPVLVTNWNQENETKDKPLFFLDWSKTAHVYSFIFGGGKFVT